MAPNPWGVAETEPEVIARLVKRMPEPHFHSVDSSHVDAIRVLLGRLADDPALIVEPCEREAFMHGPDFVRLIRECPTWDWRCELPPPGAVLLW